MLGSSVGLDGLTEGLILGLILGLPLGDELGLILGLPLGEVDGLDGLTLGLMLGLMLGLVVGTHVSIPPSIRRTLDKGGGTHPVILVRVNTNVVSCVSFPKALGIVPEICWL